MDIAVGLDIIEKSGSWFSYKGERVGQGRENVKKYLTDNPEVMAEIEAKIRENMKQAFENSLSEDMPNEEESDIDSDNFGDED